MESKSKYYTPELEEFHVGFEYEAYEIGYTYDVELIEEQPAVLQILGNPIQSAAWVKKEYSLLDFSSVIDGELDAYIPEVRVKYLDIEDIESLGWKLSHEQNSQNPKGFYFTYVFRKSGMYLDFYPNRKDKITVHNGGHYEDYNCLFTGQVKNKSELKKLLKMIGV